MDDRRVCFRLKTMRSWNGRDNETTRRADTGVKALRGSGRKWLLAPYKTHREVLECWETHNVMTREAFDRLKPESIVRAG